MGREQAQVLVQLRIALVEISCAEVRVATESSLVLPGDQNEFGMDLQFGDAKTNHHPCFLQTVADSDVLLFIKARRQFHQDLYLFSIVGCVDQRIDDLAVLGHPVEVDLDGTNRRINGRFPQKVHHMDKLMVGEMQQHVALLHGVHHTGGRLKPRVGERRLFRMGQVLPAKIRERHQVPPVVVAFARNHTCSRLQFHPAKEGLQHVPWHLAIEKKANHFARTSTLQASLHLGHHRTRQIIVHVNGCIPGRLHGVGFDGLGFKQPEDPRQFSTDDVVEEHHALGPFALWQDQEPRQVVRQLDQGQFALGFRHAQTNGQVDGPVLQFGHVVASSQHDGHKRRPNLVSEIVPNKIEVLRAQRCGLNHLNSLLRQGLLHLSEGVVKLHLQLGDPRMDGIQRF